MTEKETEMTQETETFTGEEVNEETSTVVTEVVEEVETEEPDSTLSRESELEQENQALNDQIYRLSAEIANIQKRNAKERQDAAKYRSQSIAQNLLSVVDNLERALAIEVTDEQAQSLKKGVEMVYEGFMHALKEEGIEAIDALNQPFDPMKHHAIQVLPAEEGQEPDMVVQVFQKGYLLKDRVLRPAMVIVSQ